MNPAIIFDFDGVIADSEALANTVLAEAITRFGRETNLDDALDRYMGKRWPEVIALIEKDAGRPLPADFGDTLKADTLKRFRTDLHEVRGAKDFIKKFEALPRCIASSSSTDRLTVCLEVLGLTSYFHQKTFSADLVERGKPFPDIFLFAAKQLGVDPKDCIVIEDSVSGVKAGVAAGMTVIGLCAASHIRRGHSGRLIDAGATAVVDDWAAVTMYVEQRVNA